MRPVCELNRRQQGDRRKGVAVQRNGTKRCSKGLDGRNREPLKRYIMCGANQDDALDRVDTPVQGRKGRGGHLARIDVSGMRSDEGLGRALVTGLVAMARSRLTSDRS